MKWMHISNAWQWFEEYYINIKCVKTLEMLFLVQSKNKIEHIMKLWRKIVR